MLQYMVSLLLYLQYNINHHINIWSLMALMSVYMDGSSLDPVVSEANTNTLSTELKNRTTLDDPNMILSISLQISCFFFILLYTSHNQHVSALCS